MATKAKTLQVKDKEKDDKAADAPEKDSADAPSPFGGDDEEQESKSLADFSLQDMLTQMRRIKQMGSSTGGLRRIRGAWGRMPDGGVDEGEVLRVEAIISSMTEEERRKPRLLNASRRKRIARGSGTSVQDINRLMRNYEEMRKMMKRMGKRRPRKGMPPGLQG